MSHFDLNEELTHYIVDLNDFVSIQMLGRGQYGCVYLVEENDKKRKYAMKQIVTQFDQESFMREISILMRFKHPAVLGFRGFALPYNDFPASILTSYINGGDLEHMIASEKANKAPKDWDATKKMINLYGIAAGMAYVHEKKVLHLDLKPANILLNSNFEPFIADFGISKICENTEEKTADVMGTPYYFAPEAACGKNISDKVDVYSYGVIMYYLFSGRIPFEKRFSQPLAYINFIEKGNRDRIPDSISSVFQSLIERCWNQEPNVRPSFIEILKILSVPENYLEGIDRAEFEKYKAKIDSVIESASADLNKGQQKPLYNAGSLKNTAVSMMITAKDFQKANEKSTDENTMSDDALILAAQKYEKDGNDEKKAQQLYAKVADRGNDPRGQYNLARLLFKGKYINHSLPLAEHNLKCAVDKHKHLPSIVLLGKVLEEMKRPLESFQYYKMAANLGDPEGIANYGRAITYGIGTTSDPVNAIQIFNESIEKYPTNGLAYAYLGKLYEDIIMKDNKLLSSTPASLIVSSTDEMNEIMEKVLSLYQKSADLNCVEGHNYLALCYLNGNGVEVDYVKALEHFRINSKLNDIIANFNLGRMYYKGLGVKADFDTAIALLRSAARLGYPIADVEAGNYFLEKKKPDRAIRYFIRAADNGYAPAQTIAGRSFKYGIGVTADLKRAVSFFKKAAAQDEIEAFNMLGRCYEEGDGVEKDEKEAFKLYKKAAKCNDVDGLNSLGRSLLNGIGCKVNDKKAAQAFRKAAKMGDGRSMFNYAVLLDAGRGVEQNLTKALLYFKKSANHEVPEGAVHAGFAFQDGKGTEVNMKEAKKYFKKAADMGNPVGMREYANCLLDEVEGGDSNDSDDDDDSDGEEHKVDDVINYFTKAAELGDVNAQEEIGSLYEKGKWVTKNVGNALKYYKLAAEQGSTFAAGGVKRLS